MMARCPIQLLLLQQTAMVIEVGPLREKEKTVLLPLLVACDHSLGAFTVKPESDDVHFS